MFPPHDRCGNHRFDDPEGKYRTLYCASKRITCVREILAQYRPSLETLTDLGLTQAFAARQIPLEWLRDRVLAPARIELIKGTLVNLLDPAVRHRLEREHVLLLRKHGMDHLDLDQVMGPRREVTKTIGRALFLEGAAGVSYRSRYDSEICVALFEGRARLEKAGEWNSLADFPPEVEQVCLEWELVVGR